MVFREGKRFKNRPYEIIKDFGSGGFGATYKAWHLDLEFYVVLKTPNVRLQHDGNYNNYLERFKEEGRRIAQLTQVPHAHIVRITDFFTEGDLPCLVMDYIPGDSLYNLVQEKGKLSEEKAVEYIKQIGSALTVCHEAGIIHRDAHPGNMILREDNGNVVLIDFGIAKNVGTQSVSRSVNTAFASWEQILGEDEEDEDEGDEDEVNLRELLLAPTIDVYTLAASLYYLVTAKTPTPSLARKYSGRKLKLPTQYNPEISPQLEEAIVQGMSLEPQNRPSSVKAWLDLFPKDVPLLTEVGVDYTRLRDLLAAGKWKEANEETERVMLRAADPEEYDWLIEYVLLTDFKTDLSTIDQLWVKYSSGRFGFSVLRRIWESLGGTCPWDYGIAIKLGDRVGWRRRAWEWIDYEDLVFDINAPQGHLPCPDSFIQHFQLLFEANNDVYILDPEQCTDYYDYIDNL